MDQCVPRRLYEIGSRNLVLGVFDGDKGFIGIREKFRHEFLFTEYHWDSGPPFGTVHSVEDTGIDLPEEIALSEHSGEPVDGVLQPNVPLFNWLMAKEHELMPEHRRQVAELFERMRRDDADDDGA